MKKIVKFFRDLRSEARKVTWSGFAQTRMLTIIVAIMALFFAVYMSLVDTALQTVIDFIIKF